MLWYVFVRIAVMVVYIANRATKIRLIRVRFSSFQRALRYRKGRFLSVAWPRTVLILEPGTTVTPVDVRPIL